MEESGRFAICSLILLVQSFIISLCNTQRGTARSNIRLESVIDTASTHAVARASFCATLDLKTALFRFFQPFFYGAPQHAMSDEMSATRAAAAAAAMRETGPPRGCGEKHSRRGRRRESPDSPFAPSQGHDKIMAAFNTIPASSEADTLLAPLPRTVNGTGHTGPSRFCATGTAEEARRRPRPHHRPLRRDRARGCRRRPLRGLRRRPPEVQQAQEEQRSLQEQVYDGPRLRVVRK